MLFASAELHPFVKTGGLADVSAALPPALRAEGADVRLLIPGYPALMKGVVGKRVVARLPYAFGDGEVRLCSATLADSDVPVYLIDYAPLYDRGGGAYADEKGNEWPDNVWRFALLSLVAATLASEASPLKWRPHILHCNDWHSALAPAYLRYAPGQKSAVVTTIHNLAYQGNFPPQLAAPLGLPASSFSMHGVEFYGNLSFLKAGLFYADRITTVSPTHAREIQSASLGFGMQGLLTARAAYLTGILNGIDTEQWNPSTDPYIARNYRASTLQDKSANKRALQRALELEVAPQKPLLGVISRFAYQKGLDTLLAVAPAIIRLPAQLVVLGSGDAQLEQAFKTLERDFPGQVGVRLDFDEPLSHLVTAGADGSIMPSRYEPCGLNQMYAQRYASLPVVRATGGLADSVIDASPGALAAGRGSGFAYTGNGDAALFACVQRALNIYRDRDTWRRLQKNAMAMDFSWGRSARGYCAVYEAALAGPGA
ncbi:MAG: glycogen synthase GlgA [Burkholderiales bacterium]